MTPRDSADLAKFGTGEADAAVTDSTPHHARPPCSTLPRRSGPKIGVGNRDRSDPEVRARLRVPRSQERGWSGSGPQVTHTAADEPLTDQFHLNRLKQPSRPRATSADNRRPGLSRRGRGFVPSRPGAASSAAIGESPPESRIDRLAYFVAGREIGWIPGPGYGRMEKPRLTRTAKTVRPNSRLIVNEPIDHYLSHHETDSQPIPSPPERRTLSARHR